MKISTIKELSKLLEYDEIELEKIIQIAPKCYTDGLQPKKDGSFREISIPNKKLKELQRKLLTLFFYNIELCNVCYGNAGTSTKMAMKKHIGKEILIKVDIKNFFPSVKSRMIRKSLRDRGYSKEISDAIVRLTTRSNSLPQGAPTSPYIAAMVMNPILLEIKKAIGSKIKVDISSWVDDITISGPMGLRKFKNVIHKIIERNGFTVHPDKFEIIPNSREQANLGIKVNNKLEPSSSIMDSYTKTIKENGYYSKRAIGQRNYIKYVTK